MTVVPFGRRLPAPPAMHVHLWEGRALSEPIFVVDLVAEDDGHLTLGTWDRISDAFRAAQDCAAASQIPVRVSLWPEVAQ